jgi:DNA-binding transcriptional LysR family regulator
MIFLAELECDAKKHRASPIVRVQIIVTNRRVDLIEEAIDIAVRVGKRLDTDQALQVKQIGGSKRILVAAPQLFEKEKPPDAPAELVRFPILCQQEQQGPTTRTLTTESGEEETVRLTPKLATDFGILVDAARDACCRGRAAGRSSLPVNSCKFSRNGA